MQCVMWDMAVVGSVGGAAQLLLVCRLQKAGSSAKCVADVRDLQVCPTCYAAVRSGPGPSDVRFEETRAGGLR